VSIHQENYSAEALLPHKEVYSENNFTHRFAK